MFAEAVTQQPDSELPFRKIGEYEITARIGVGGMGVVYEGRQPVIGKRVAVKVLMPQVSNEKELVDRFIAEARSVNEIRHRGIVDIFSFGQLPDGSHYFVMEYLEGEPFDRLIKRRGPMPVAEVLSLVEEILDALDAAHAAGVIHRDIKPSNLFLVNQGRGRSYVKLLDFGIAKLGVTNNTDTPQTRASVILGTPDYISPEQARGRPISARTDLYAVGVVMFEMLTGERPFRGENTLATMWMHVEDAPPVASDVRPEIPPQLDELILWAMEKDPAKRPQSAEDMRAHVEAIRASLLPGTSSPTPAPFTGRENSVSGFGPGPKTPSGRKSGTPAPRPRTPLPGGARKSGPASIPILPDERPQSHQETRLAPLPALDDYDELRTTLERPDQVPGANVRRPSSTKNPAPRVPITAEEARDDDFEPTADGSDFDESGEPKGKTGWLIGGLVVLVLLAGGAIYYISQGSPVTPSKADPSPLTPISAPTEPSHPVDSKPKEPKPVDTKPVDAKPVDTKPVDTKPVDTKPVDAKPVDSKPVDSKPVDAKPVDAKPVDAKPVDAKPVDAKPVDKPVTDKKPVVDKKPIVEKPPTTTDTSKPKVSDKPATKGVTNQQLEARLAKLESQLAAKEAQAGEADKVTRSFMSQAKKMVAGAQTDADRREAAKFLDELADQVGH